MRESHWDDESYESEADQTDIEADSATQNCPYCGKAIYEDAERCPHCERYLSDEDSPRKKPWWIFVGAAVCLYIVYHWLFW